MFYFPNEKFFSSYTLVSYQRNLQRELYFPCVTSVNVSNQIPLVSSAEDTATEGFLFLLLNSSSDDYVRSSLK